MPGKTRTSSLVQNFFLRNQDLENEDSIGLGSMVFNQYIHIYLMYLYIHI